MRNIIGHFFLLVLMFTNASALAENKPNVIVILADDIGVGDISFYSKQFAKKKPVVHTHNIDQLAKQGVWFTDAHSATALCAPTRYAVMTGKNNYRSYAPWGVWGSFQPNAISAEEPTLGSILKQQGYNTGFVGKWHLGGDFKLKGSEDIYRGTDEGALNHVDLSKMVGGGPRSLGFNYDFTLPDGIQGPLYLAYENESWFPLSEDSKIQHINKRTVKDLRIISDKGDGMGDSHWDTANIGSLISQKAADFILSQNQNTPFFLYYASPMAHRPHIAPKTFDGVKVQGKTPSAHLDMVYELDLQIGRIISALKSKEMYDNTLIIFTSDNGGLTWKVPGTLESGHQPSGIYRGSKNTPHEGGHRVPFIVSWGNKKLAKSINDEPVLVQDILATITAASGHFLQEQQAPDSNNLMPLLMGYEGYQPRNYLMLQGGSRNELIYREGDWKLIINSNNGLTKFEPVALFNLAMDVSEKERNNLINKPAQQKRVAELLARYLNVRRSKVPTI